MGENHFSVLCSWVAVWTFDILRFCTPRSVRRADVYYRPELISSCGGAGYIEDSPMALLHHESFGSSEGADATADTDSTHTGTGATRVNG